MSDIEIRVQPTFGAPGLHVIAKFTGKAGAKSVYRVLEVQELMGLCYIARFLVDILTHGLAFNRPRGGESTVKSGNTTEQDSGLDV